MSYSTLYLLFVITALLLFNALILLARYSRQVKSPPKDEEYQTLETENTQLQTSLEKAKMEISDLKNKMRSLEIELQTLKMPTSQQKAG